MMEAFPVAQSSQVEASGTANLGAPLVDKLGPVGGLSTGEPLAQGGKGSKGVVLALVPVTSPFGFLVKGRVAAGGLG